jgi:ubiquinone/menaquinone biosynthesis C-methylase UbiE
MPMNQNSTFLNGEGDAWFIRNERHLDVGQITISADVRYICETLSPFRHKMNNILEIGCSNGVKLEAICKHFSANGEGIDPSEAAVISGNSRKKDTVVNLRQGTGDNLPFQDQSFDLVYFAFCLYLFDRSSLLRSLAEADRVLKPGGYLMITDFDPGSPRKRTYAHKAGMFSYKQNYANFFTETGLYYLVGKHSFSHNVDYFDETADERVTTDILFKEVDPFLTQD